MSQISFLLANSVLLLLLPSESSREPSATLAPEIVRDNSCTKRFPEWDRSNGVSPLGRDTVCLVHRVWELLASSGLTRNRYYLHPSDGRRENTGNPVHMMSSLGLQGGAGGGGDYSTHRLLVESWRPHPTAVQAGKCSSQLVGLFST